MALPFIATLAVTFLAWAVAAVLSQSMGDAMTLSSSVWLATGVTFGALLAVKPPKRPAVLAGAALAATALALLDGLTVLPALAFGINEALAAGLGAWVARLLRATGPEGRMEPGKAYAGFLLGALLTSMLGASIGVMLWSWALPQPIALLVEWRVWTCTTFVGILLIAPLITSFAGFRVKRSGGMATSQFLAGAGTFVLFFVVAALIFSSDVSDRFSASLGPTLTYLPLPFMVVTAILWKERGATLATLLGALALIAWTNTGGGPFAEVEGFPGEAVIEVQGYVAVMALLVGVVNALGATAAQALALAQDWRTRYRQVLESNRTVVANFDAKTGTAQWGEGASELLRTNAAALLTVQDYIAHADPQDQSALQADWRDLAQGQREHALWKNSLRWSDGRVATVSARLSGVRGADGQVEQVAVLLEVEA
ncbi:MASE1 domain-containing protein [Polaromonas sp. LjRoot131]|uniref:MASE1 domain-containing protein n=1 Tax=Polaromonas sp. LjRoot131 TaxID=3342262 RepID=UPI003ECC91B4